MNREKKIIWAMLIVIEFLIICSCLCFYGKEGRQVSMMPSDFHTEEGIFLENFLDTGLDGYYIDSSFEENTDFAQTTPVDLGPGSYLVRMYYATEGGAQTYTFNKKDVDFRFRIGNWKETLPSGKNCYTASIWSIYKVEDFSINYHYSGEGYLLVSKVEIIEQRLWAVVLMPFLAVFFLFLDLAVWNRKRIQAYFTVMEHRVQWTGCLLIIVFASLPLFMPALLDGHDLEFHLMRIEGIKEGLQSGQFPVKIQPNWMNGYGYGASFFYGDIFLYFPALLRLGGIGIQGAYKAFTLLMNVLACLLSYYAFRRFFNDYRIGLVGSFLYTCSIYRLNCIYIRAAVGEYSAITFLPLFFVGISEILFGGNITVALSGKEAENKIKAGRIKGWMLAAFSYAGILYSHLITSEIVALLTILAGLVFWHYTFRKECLQKILKCALMLVGCSVGFLVPFLDMSRDPYSFNALQNNLGIQSSGASFYQILTIFPNGAGEALSHTMLERTTRVNEEMPYAIGGGGTWRRPAYF